MSRFPRPVSLTGVSRRVLSPLVLLWVLGLAACTAAPNAPLAAGDASPSSATVAGATTVVVVRHAEKVTEDPSDRDPGLVEIGQARARALVEVLAEAGLDAAYVTQYRRTRLTAEPAAERFGAPVLERPCCDPDVPTWAAGLAADLLAEHAGETLLVVGHSNTVPEIVEALSGHHPGAMTEAEYDHLFVVVVPGGGKPPRLFKSRFGAVSATGTR